MKIDSHLWKHTRRLKQCRSNSPPGTVKFSGAILHPRKAIVGLAALLFGSMLNLAVADTPAIVELWTGEVPDESHPIGSERFRMSPALDRTQVEVTEPTRMITDVSKPTMAIYSPPAGMASGTAVVICPGGGYWNLYWDLEGEEVARWLNSVGITGVILKYRVPRRPGEIESLPAARPLQDAQRAVSLLRSKADSFHIHPDKIGIIGFSAGGHLAIATATEFEKRTYLSRDDADQVSCRPDFCVAVYPGYLKKKDAMELNPSIRIPKQTPPVFLVHGGADLISPPENSVLMYLALREAGVSSELHVYASTTHDFGVRKSDLPHGTWTGACVAWMKRQEFIPASPSTPPPQK